MGDLPRRRVVRHALRSLLALAAAAALASVATAFASGGGEVVKISDDPFTNSQSQHRSEVEPDTFSFGRTVVSGFQVGRIFDGGASDIGFATSRDGGEHWVHGFLPGVTKLTTPAGVYDRASDASVAFDARDRVWVISYLAIHNTPTGGTFPVDVLTSRSHDGVHWELPVVVAAIDEFLDKNWSVCDNSPRSPFFGHCYTEFDSPTRRDLELMSTSVDGARSWGPAMTTADMVHGIGGQPLVQPNGRVVVPFESVGATPTAQKAFSSDNGGASWNASVVISTRSSHRVAGDLRTSSLPTAEIDGQGRVFVAWQDSRFEANSSSNDIVFSTSTNGTTWSPVRRVPLDPVGSGVDHFIPGLGVDRASSDRHTHLALAYYFYPNAACTAATCQLEVGFTSSTDGGATWTRPEKLAGPMNLSWLPLTSQGPMVADYISTSILTGTRTAVPAFAVASPPASATMLNQPMFAAREEVRNGSVRLNPDDPVLFHGFGVDGNGQDDNDDGGQGGGAPRVPTPPTSF